MKTGVPRCDQDGSWIRKATVRVCRQKREVGVHTCDSGTVSIVPTAVLTATARARRATRNSVVIMQAVCCTVHVLHQPERGLMKVLHHQTTIPGHADEDAVYIYDHDAPMSVRRSGDLSAHQQQQAAHQMVLLLRSLRWNVPRGVWEPSDCVEHSRRVQEGGGAGTSAAGLHQAQQATDRAPHRP